ncbi:MAG: M23 family metallopeptidase [Ignavibacteriaceae bacterium]|nr:M23 family metallopeptidase [Ignavibacteriaceae bacterium]
MKPKKFDIKKLFKLNRLSILVIPDRSDLNTKTRQYYFREIAIIALIYSIIIAILGFLTLNLTPLRGIFVKSSNISSTDLKTINELNDRMIKLSKELNEIRSSDERLKKVVRLTDSTIFHMVDPVKTIKNKTGGNILSVFRQLLVKFRLVQQESISFLRPVSGFISRNFDPERGHMGVDFVVKSGTPVYVSANGFVIFANYTVRDGNMIIVSHPGNYISIYKHCSSLLKKERDIVIQGELIALSGNTGEITTGAHLHFEIWKDGVPINPITILLKN